jgi:hypothetical protein
MKNLIFFIALCLILNSCLSYGYRTGGNYVFINGLSEADSIMYSDSLLKYHKYITMYFSDEGYKQKEYLELGTVEVTGAKYDNTEYLYDALKVLAWKMNAHAIINIKQYYKKVDRGYISFIELKNNVSDSYDAIVYKAVAIRFKTHHPDLVMKPIKLLSDSNSTY